MRRIPRKVVFSGDEGRCQSVMKLAEARLVLLEERLRRGGLAQGWQQPIMLSSGEEIRLAVFFGFSVIEIFADSQPEDQRKRERECFCNCNFAIGKITSILNEDKLDLPDEDEEKEDWPVYRVSVCQGKRRSIAFENLIGSDFTPWEIGQKVMVMAYHDFHYQCCTNESLATGCAGIVDRDYMIEGEPDMTQGAWRTTFRIVPFCAIPIRFWREFRG